MCYPSEMCELLCNLQEIKTVLENESRLDSHRTADAFVLVLLTHGSQGSIFGVDGDRVRIEDITTLFDGNHCPHLQNKPKLFFIQACQGSEPHNLLIL